MKDTINRAKMNDVIIERKDRQEERELLNAPKTGVFLNYSSFRCTSCHDTRPRKGSKKINGKSVCGECVTRKLKKE